MTALRKWLLRGLVLFTALFALAIVSVLLLLGTSPGLSLTTNLINALASNQDQQIELTGIDSLLGDIQIGSLRLSDSEGIWFEASNLSAHYSLGDLLGLGLTVDDLTLSEIKVHRAPQARTNAPLEDTQSQGSLNQLPLAHIEFGKISIRRISLGKALLGKAAELGFSGSASVIGSPFQTSGSLKLHHIQDPSSGITANWDINPEQNRQKLAFNLSEPRGGMIARLLDIADLPALEANLQGDGPLDQWQSDLAVRLDGKPVVDGHVTIGLVDQTQRIDAKLTGQLSPFLPESVIPLVAGTSNLSARLERTESDVFHLKQMSFRSGLATLQASGFLDNRDESLSLNTSFELGQEGLLLEIQQTDANPLHLGHTKLDGQVNGSLRKAMVHLSGSIAQFSQDNLTIEDMALALAAPSLDLIDRKGALNGSMKIAQTGTGSKQLDSVIDGGTSLIIEANLDGQTINLAQGKLNAGSFAALISGDYAPDALDLEGQFTLSEMRRIDPTLSGSLLGNMTVSGVPQAPRLELSVQGEALGVDNKAIDDLTLQLVATETQSVSLKLSTLFNKAPIAASLGLTTNEDGGRLIDNIEITGPGAKIAGKLALSPEGLAQGILDATINDLAALGSLILQPDLEGSVEANIELSTTGGKQNALIKANAADIATKDLSLSALSLQSKINDAAGSMGMESRVNIGTIRAAGETIRSLDARISGKNGILPFKLNANVSNTPMSLSGRVIQQDDQTLLDLDQFVGSWKAIALSLASPTQLDLTNGIKLSQPLKLNIDKGQAVLTGSAADQLNLGLVLKNLPLSIADKVAPTGEAPRGQVDLTAQFSGVSSNPVVSWQGTLSGISANSTRQAGLPAFSIATSGSFQNNLVTMKTHLTGGGANLKADGQIAVARQAMDIKASGALPFSLAARSLADAGLQLTGSANLSARISGSFAKTDINGTLTTENARFSEFSSGLVIRNLGGTLSLTGQQAKIENINGHLGKDGTIAINGLVGLEPNAGLPADIKLTISNGSFKHEDILTSLFDANLNLKGQLADRSVISGQISLNTTEILIPEKLPDSLSPLDVSHKNAQGRTAEQAESFQPKKKQAASGPAMLLDMAISAPRRIYVRGRGMDSELGGTIRVTGTTASPNPVGSILMQRGRMDILTKRLDFDSGVVTFAGTLDPSLDFTASTTNSGTTFTVAVGGYASAPEISLSSSPTLPEDEILAQLFFDKSLSDLSPIQLAQLANAVATLSGANSGPSVLDRLRNMAGIDNIDIKSDAATNETTVGVGSYLNDKTYINVEKSTASDAGKVSIDLDITDNFKAHGEADSSGKTKAGIFFEKDY